MSRERVASNLMICAGLAAGAAAAMLAAAPATAHHSYTMFDLGKEATLTGTVQEFQWTAPHAWIELNVAARKGSPELWSIEGMSPNYLARRGWSRHSLKPGDKVSVVIHPLKDGARGGTVVRVILQDGRVLDQHGQS